MLKMLIFALIISLSACSSLQTPDYKSAEFVMGSARSPNSVAGNTSIVDAMRLSWPIDGHVRINQEFKASSSKRDRHLGIDIAGVRNEPIFSAQDGYVIYAGRGFHGYGKMIIVESRDQGYATFYAHLNKIDIKQGRYVHRGDMIGRMGRTGHATGVHLHFELRVANLPVDPIRYLPPKAILTKN